MQESRRHRKRCSASLSVREVDVEATAGSRSHPSGWQKAKTQQTASVGEDVEQGDPPVLLGAQAVQPPGGNRAGGSPRPTDRAAPRPSDGTAGGLLQRQ